MSHTTYATAWALKHAKMPQPEPEFGQIWYTGQRESKIVIVGPVDFEGDYPHVPDHHVAIYSGEKEDWAFAPDAEYITALLPPGWALGMWDGKPSCTNSNDEFPIRVWGDTFAEAAAGMWLEVNALKEKIGEIIATVEEKTRQLPK